MTLQLDLPKLLACGFGPSQARGFLAPLIAACERFEINTPQRVGGFLAQVWTESNGLRDLEENLFYSTAARLRLVWPSRFANEADAVPFLHNPQALANRVYSLRNGNGDVASNDGWRYRGRGLVQLTGRTNYTNATKVLGVDYVGSPELVALPADACLTAAWKWSAAGANSAADVMNWDAITRMINGPGMREAPDRASRSFANFKALR